MGLSRAFPLWSQMKTRHSFEDEDNVMKIEAWEHTHTHTLPHTHIKTPDQSLLWLYMDTPFAICVHNK